MSTRKSVVTGGQKRPLTKSVAGSEQHILNGLLPTSSPMHNPMADLIGPS